ncbi:TrkH family potassium uptake protein [Virgibacillus kekensis]|uniref:TrkH family potassium uptake protein n=1 Tax=Virgibacillus kekensis TaxID=202261 RepID=A0ABV9DNB9_9BACI
MRSLLHKLTTVQLIAIFYITAIVGATLLLSIPLLHRDGVELTFLESMFTAVSAITVTGLTVVTIAETFNPAGYIAIIIILQLGGIGVMTFGTFIWMLFGNRVGLRGRKLIRADQNRGTFADLVHLMISIFRILLLIELIGGLILSFYFLNYFDTWQEAFIQGFFASVCATTNAGFDITGQSLIPFAGDYFVQFIVIILIILGAIGFPVLIEVKELLSGKYNKVTHKYNFSLFTKITSTTFLVLVIIGWVLIFALEYNHFFSDKTWHEKIFYSLFQSVSSRSGGLTTMDMNGFSIPTLLVLSALMFIGASPSSVGGGIRTTTFAIMLLAIYNFAKGNRGIKIFGREIEEDDIHRSFIVVTTGVMLVSSAVILVSMVEDFPLLAIMFEITSAFGTTGLSMGITQDLTVFSKCILMILMFIGRVGIFSFLFLIRGEGKTDLYHFPKEKVIIG